MNKLVTGALALALSVSLTACSKATENNTVSSPGASTTTQTSPSGSTGTSTGTSTGASTATGTATVAVDQSTPELAMTSWFNAMVAGDGRNVCGLMATKGQPIGSVPAALDACVKMITPMLQQITQLGGAFEGLTIKGATIKGNTATFESVTTEPAIAADVVANFKAVKIGDKWYVTQG
jgi:hypothetical protein